MAASASDKLRKLSRRWVGQIGAGGVSDDTTTTIPLASTTNLATDTAVTLVIDRVDSSGSATPTLEETIVGVVSGSNIINAIRGVEGTAQAHNAGAVVEVLVTADGYNDIIDHLLVGHLQSGAHASGLVFQSPTLSSPTLSGTVAGNFTASGNVTFTGTVTGAGAATWTAFSGAYASGTTITATGVDMTGVMKKGVVLKWTDSAGSTFKTGMVISSSFSTNTTITIVGSTVASGDKSFYYGPFANQETFIIPGSLASGTDMAKTWYAPEDVYPLSVDARLKTNTSSSECIFDVNDDGTSIISTKPTISASAVSDLNNVVSTPTAEIAKDSAVTVDIDQAVSGPIEAYVDLFYYPKSMTSRT